MLRYAKRMPENKPVEILDNGNVRKVLTRRSEVWMEYMKALLNHFTKHPDPMVVPIYDYKILSESSYQYDMMRCGLLTEEERYLITLVSDLHDRYQIAACQVDFDPELIEYKEKCPKLFEFLKQVVEQDRYWDLHSGNILLNEDGEYCLIDLEGFMLLPLSKADNNWITRE